MFDPKYRIAFLIVGMKTCMGEDTDTHSQVEQTMEMWTNFDYTHTILLLVISESPDVCQFSSTEATSQRICMKSRSYIDFLEAWVYLQLLIL